MAQKKRNKPGDKSRQKRSTTKQKKSREANPINLLSNLWTKERKVLLLAFGILVLGFITFFPLLENDFTDWDDNLYVTESELIKDLSFSGIKKIFSSEVAANYHPITILSLAVNHSISGMSPTGYIATNILFHLLNTFLVFLFIYLISGKKSSIALIVSLFFCVHPMHVESVAWISERKDVLYTFFMLLAMITYLMYLEKPGKKLYAVISIFFVLSLLSKPAAVVFPVLLLLIDYFSKREINLKVLLEKIPFFILSLIIGVATIKIQSVSAMEVMESFTLGQRILLSSYGFIIYMAKLIFPIPLSALHPFPIAGNFPAIYYIAPVLCLVVLGMAYYFRKNRVLVFGLGFYLVSIAPVLQFISIGNAVIAERYTYVPYIGLFLIIGYLYHHVLQKATSSNTMKVSFKAILGVFVIAFVILSFQRTKVWKNGETLWANVIDSYSYVPIAHYHRGYYYNKIEDYEKSLADFNRVIQLNSNYTKAYIIRADILEKTGKQNLAMEDYNKAIQLQPNEALFYYNRGNLLLSENQNSNALVDYNKAIELEPDYLAAYINRGRVYFNLKRNEDAINDYSKAIMLDNNYAKAYNERAKVRHLIGQVDAACSDLNKAASLGFQPAIDILPRLCN